MADFALTPPPPSTAPAPFVLSDDDHEYAVGTYKPRYPRDAAQFYFLDAEECPRMADLWAAGGTAREHAVQIANGDADKLARLSAMADRAEAEARAERLALILSASAEMIVCDPETGKFYHEGAEIGVWDMFQALDIEDIDCASTVPFDEPSEMTEDGTLWLTDELGNLPDMIERTLHAAGDAIDWRENWEIDHETGRAYLCQTQYYGWLPRYWRDWETLDIYGAEFIDPRSGYNDNEDFDPEICARYVAFLTNNPEAADIFGLPLEDLGFEEVECGFETGFHRHQNDDPHKIMAALDTTNERYVFGDLRTGQFDARYCLYKRTGTAIEDYAEFEDYFEEYVKDYGHNK